MEQEVVLEVKNLKTYFYNYDRELRAVDDLSYKVHRGECVAIIGESGSGKTVSALSILRPDSSWAVRSCSRVRICCR